MNFVESTRYSREKHHRQQSAYPHLLQPKAGGIAFVLGAMGEEIHHILDVTIVYPDGVKSFWALLCGNIREIRVRVRSLAVGMELRGDYLNDGMFRQKMQQWLNNLWAEKQRCIDEMMMS